MFVRVCIFGSACGITVLVLPPVSGLEPRSSEDELEEELDMLMASMSEGDCAWRDTVDCDC